MDIGTHLLDVARVLFGEAHAVSCLTSRTLPARRRRQRRDRAAVDGRRATHVIVELGYAGTPLDAAHEVFPQTLALVEGSRGSIELAGGFRLRVTTRRGTRVTRHPPPRYDWVDRPVRGRPGEHRPVRGRSAEGPARPARR